MTILFHHPAFSEHRPGPHHPESPARIKALMDALAAPAFAGLDRREAPRATVDQIARVHPRPFVEALLAAVPAHGTVQIDGDTAMSPGSGEAALRASGAAVAAVDAVMAGAAKNAFCAVRPPGHHAEPARAMGFCLFNSIAVGALHARAAHGLDRVAVIDFDVHHGNGTQASFWDDRDLFYASSHQFPLYPGTGAERERGVGNIVNAPLRPGSGSDEFRAAYRDRILPALAAFQPEIVLISAGFDAHADDPLAGLNVATGDYAWVTAELCKVAAETAQGRVVSALEGGYDLHALADAAGAHVRALMAA